MKQSGIRKESEANFADKKRILLEDLQREKVFLEKEESGPCCLFFIFFFWAAFFSPAHGSFLYQV